MQTGYSIFGGPVETMDGPVRAVSIMPRYIHPGAFGAETPTAVATPGHPHLLMQRAPTRIAAPSATGRRPGSGAPPGSVAYPGVPRAGVGPGPGSYVPHQGTPLPAHPGGTPPGMMVPGPRPMPMQPAQPRYPGRPMPGGTPPGMMVPGPVPSPHQPWQKPHTHHMTPTPRGPVPTPCTCPPVLVPPPCAPCNALPMPLTGPIHFYNPTPRSPISPATGYCPPPGVGPMTDGCGHVVDAHGAAMYHPGGSYPITQHGPGLHDGLTKSQVLHGQLPVGAGTDIFGGTVNAEDPMSSRPIGPSCNGTGPMQMQPQVPYNAPMPCGGHVPGTGHGAGVFAARSGVFGAGPDGLGRFF